MLATRYWVALLSFILLFKLVHNQGLDTRTEVKIREDITGNLRTLRNELKTRKTTVGDLGVAPDLPGEKVKLDAIIKQKYNELKLKAIEFGEKCKMIQLNNDAKAKLDTNLKQINDDLEAHKRILSTFASVNNRREYNMRVYYVDYKGFVVLTEEHLYINIFRAVLEPDITVCSPRTVRPISLPLPSYLKQFIDNQAVFDHLVNHLIRHPETHNIARSFDTLVKDAAVNVQLNQSTCLNSTGTVTENYRLMHMFMYSRRMLPYASGPNAWQLICRIRTLTEFPAVPEYTEAYRLAIKDAVKAHIKGLQTFVYQSVEEICTNIIAKLEANETFYRFMVRPDYYQSCTRCLVRKEVLERLKAMSTPATISATTIVVICMCGAIIGILLIVVLRMHLMKAQMPIKV